MPEPNTVELAHEVAGSDDSPLLLLGGALGGAAAMWEPQVDALSEYFRVVRFEHRGHGRSPVPPGPYALGDLGRDVLALMDRLGARQASYAGLSLGGMVGMWLAANAPSRIDRLALVCTSPHLPPIDNWLARAASVRTSGMEAVADATLGRWFTLGFASPLVDRIGADLRATSPSAYASCCEAIGHMDLRSSLHRISAPTLVIAGSEDQSTPASHGRSISEAIDGAQFELVRAAHVSNVEAAADVTPLLLAHLWA